VHSEWPGHTYEASVRKIFWKELPEPDFFGAQLKSLLLRHLAVAAEPNFLEVDGVDLEDIREEVMYMPWPRHRA
jgi:hypothetical protein